MAEPETPVFNTALVNVLFVKTSVVALPTNVSVELGRVTVMSEAASGIANVNSEIINGVLILGALSFLNYGLRFRKKQK